MLYREISNDFHGLKNDFFSKEISNCDNRVTGCEILLFYTFEKKKLAEKLTLDDFQSYLLRASKKLYNSELCLPSANQRVLRHSFTMASKMETTSKKSIKRSWWQMIGTVFEISA